jgi:hypothetical protein
VSDRAASPDHDSDALDAVERRFWRGIVESPPAAERGAQGIECKRFGPVQVTAIAALPHSPWINLVLGATRPGAVDEGHLEAALAWVGSQGVAHYVPTSPGQAGTAAAERCLADNGYRRGYGWMKFVHDGSQASHPQPDGPEIFELGRGEGEAFGRIAATGFGLPDWASALFEFLAGREGWRLYLGAIEGVPVACGATLIAGGIAELGIGATLEQARGRGCQLALLRRRVRDAADAGCRTLFVETGERAEGKPSTSYRNILRAGFREAYVRPNWERPG